MRDTNVAGRYAKALQLLAERHAGPSGPVLIERLEQSLEDLRSVAVLVRPGTRLGNFLGSPEVRPDEKRALLKKALDGRVLPSVVVFADLLLRKKRLVLMDLIVTDFAALVSRAKGLQVATVFSAIPLSAAEIDRLHAELETYTKSRIVMTAIVDPELIGGAYVRIGDHIIDRSVRSLLQTIANQLYEVSV